MARPGERVEDEGEGGSVGAMLPLAAAPWRSGPADREGRRMTEPQPFDDPLALTGFEAIEFWVGNARQAAHFYRTGYGFRPVAYAGPETGVRDRASYVLAQGEVVLVLTSALSDDHEIARFACRHGDGVRDI